MPSDADLTLIYANDCLRSIMNPEYADRTPPECMELMSPAEVFGALRALEGTQGGGVFARMRPIMGWEYALHVGTFMHMTGPDAPEDLDYLRVLAERLIAENPSVLWFLPGEYRAVITFATPSGAPPRIPLLIAALAGSEDAGMLLHALTRLSSCQPNAWGDEGFTAYLSACARDRIVAVIANAVTLGGRGSSQLPLIIFLDGFLRFTQEEVREGIQPIIAESCGISPYITSTDPHAFRVNIKAKVELYEWNMSRMALTFPRNLVELSVVTTDATLASLKAHSIPYTEHPELEGFLLLKSSDATDLSKKLALAVERTNTPLYGPNVDVWKAIEAGRNGREAVKEEGAPPNGQKPSRPWVSAEAIRRVDAMGRGVRADGFVRNMDNWR